MGWKLWGAGGLLAVAVLAYVVIQNRLNAPMLPGGDELASLRDEVKAQNEAAFDQPAQKPAHYPAPSDTKNVYFGDLHVHTAISFDSYIFGNRLSPEEAYKIAKGDAVENVVGEIMQLVRPLDFTAITDHAEGFGLFELCARQDLTKDQQEYCHNIDHPSPGLFLELRNEGVKRPPVNQTAEFIGSEEEAQAAANLTWESLKVVAEAHYEPGKFTTFAGYEYSPVLPDSGKHHRNIIFRSMETPDYAISAFHALSEIDLWKQLEATCQEPCRFLTIPHNPNKTWGLAFASHTIDGIPYTEEDWDLRRRSEPLVEMFQGKGNSECVIGFGSTDEECSFEQFFPPCEEGQETSCIKKTSMMRDGLKKGLVLEDELGFNPLEFGVIGSTDTHNSNPGDTEEWDFRGLSAYLNAPASRRLAGGRGGNRGMLLRNAGGLAAVWARENTREALFDAMKAKEVYATSGTRLKVRFFGGAGLDDALLEDPEMLTKAYAAGVPMGGRIPAPDQPMKFLVLAEEDPDSAPIDKIQMIKGWVEDGVAKETVVDVICSDNRRPDPETRRCSRTKADVNLSNCGISGHVGATELNALWSDPDYSSTVDAFYYIRVIQNPTCRWTTFDALRLGAQPPDGVPATITEMAWSSAIWVQAQ